MFVYCLLFLLLLQQKVVIYHRGTHIYIKTKVIIYQVSIITIQSILYHTIPLLHMKVTLQLCNIKTTIRLKQQY